MNQEHHSSAYKPATLDPVKKLAQRILRGTATPGERVIIDHLVLTELIMYVRSTDCKIVFVTGVWDLFHIGHAEYLRQCKLAAAKYYPDHEHALLIVGVDSDALTKERKGPKRPIVPQEERFSILAHNRAVDIVTPQNVANELFRLIEHDVRVISTSTTDLPTDHDEIKQQCEHLENLPPQAETSTSARIRLLALDGGLEVIENVRKRMARIVTLIEQELKEVSDELSA